MAVMPDAAPDPRSLYVHVPFCAHRCGYCDFVTTSRSPELHERYVAALATEARLRGHGERTYDTIFVGGGTPTLLEPSAMDSLLGWVEARAAAGAEVTLECNPETVDRSLAQRIVDGGVTRVSLGAQSFAPHVLATLERRADPDTVRRAVATLRDAGVQHLSLDLIWGVPGQQPQDVTRDLGEALALEPDHLSAYELEFKPGTRLAHAFGTDRELAVGEAGEELYDLVVDRLEAAGWWWYETANFARTPDDRCAHNLAYWHADPWDAVGVGAVATAAVPDATLVRRTTLPNVPRWLAAVEAGTVPPERVETVPAATARAERIMLGIRLDAPVRIHPADLLDEVVDAAGLERVAELGLGTVTTMPDDDGVHRGAVELRLNRRGRMLQGSVAGLLIDP